MSLYAFDFRDQLYAPWEQARGALIEQLDLLYAGLNAATITKDANGAVIGIGGDAQNNVAAATIANTPAQTIFQATSTLNTTQLRSGSTVPIEIVPGIPAKLLYPMSVEFMVNVTTGFPAARTAVLKHTGSTTSLTSAVNVVSSVVQKRYAVGVAISQNLDAADATGGVGAGLSVVLSLDSATGAATVDVRTTYTVLTSTF